MHPSARLTLTLMIMSLSGCALFAPATSSLLEKNEALSLEQVQDFETRAPIRRVVRLGTSIVSARSSDRRIQMVWEELDECGPMSPEDRRRLNESGIRVGVAGGALPWSLQNLLNGDQIRTGPNTAEQTIGGRSSSFGMNVAIPEGSPSVVELPVDASKLFIPPDQIAGLKQGGELENARCILQLNAIEYGDGWVVIQVLPQIHYGASTTRFSVAQEGTHVPVRQRIQPLYEQQFQLKLHTNESVVIGQFHQKEWSIGKLLFQSNSLASQSERMLALQLTGVDEVSGKKQVAFSYQKY